MVSSIQSLSCGPFEHVKVLFYVCAEGSTGSFLGKRAEQKEADERSVLMTCRLFVQRPMAHGVGSTCLFQVDNGSPEAQRHDFQLGGKTDTVSPGCVPSDEDGPHWRCWVFILVNRQ